MLPVEVGLLHKKGGLIVGFLFLLLITLSLSFVVAIDSTSTDTAKWDWSGGSTTKQVWEFASNELTIYIKQTGSTLQGVTIYTNGTSSLTLLQPTSTCQLLGTTITCSGAIGDLSEIRLNSTASEVPADTDFTWTVLTNDSVDGVESWSLTFTVKNDTIGPAVSSSAPTNYKFIQNESSTITINFTEEHSGFLNGSLPYRDNTIFDSDIRGSLVTGTLVGSCTTTQCTFSLNPNTQMGLASGKVYFDSYVSLRDNAGNVNDSYLYHLYVDASAPIVAAGNPANATITSANSEQFFYTMSDNSFTTTGVGSFNPSVGCSLYIDNTLKGSNTETANTSSSNITGNLSTLTDGTHGWYVTCTDSSGRATATTAKTLIIDRTGPSIQLTSPSNSSVIPQGRMINLTVSDSLSTVDQVWATLDGVATTISPLGGGVYTINSSSWVAGSRSLSIYSNDSLGNPSQIGYTFTIDTAAPQITLLSPTNNSYNNKTFTANATDDYSSSFSCTLVMNGTDTSSKTVSSGTSFQYVVNITDGAYAWKVRCTDNVGNTATSEERLVTVDTTAPVVTLSAPANNTNHPTGVSSFNVTQESATDNCTVYVNGIVLSGAIAYQNAPHYWNASCMDIAGNIGWSTETRIVYQDNVTPSISAVQNDSISITSFNVSWTSDEQANNTVWYGISSGTLTSKAYGTILTTSPDIAVTGLSASTTYYYLVQSCDRWNNCANSTQFNVTTAANPPSPPESPGGGGGGGGSTPKATCEDGTDNDGDGFTDLSDPGCSSSSDSDETNVAASSTESACTTQWRCTEWSECNDGTQTRVCQDWHLCGTNDGKPEESQACGENDLGTSEFASDTAIVEEVGEKTGNFLTGAFTAVASSLRGNGKALAIVTTLAILAGLGAWKKDTLFSGIHHVRELRIRRQRREEETIREKLRREGIIK